jgi:hypothetical protein
MYMCMYNTHTFSHGEKEGRICMKKHDATTPLHPRCLNKPGAPHIHTHIYTYTYTRRLKKRDNCSEEACNHAIASQMPQETKCRLADICICNDGDLQELQQQVDATCRTLNRDINSHVTRVWKPSTHHVTLSSS